MRISDWSSDVCSSDLTDASLKSLVSGVCAAVAAVALGQIAPAQAAGWPERPVQVIVPWSAGGGTDATGRIIAKMLQDDFHQPFNVVTRPSRRHVVGHTAHAPAPADGYTLGLYTHRTAPSHTPA